MNEMIMQPRIVSMPDLLRTLAPLLVGATLARRLTESIFNRAGDISTLDAQLRGAIDDVISLWRIGAPDPSSVPCRCRDVRICPHEKRILLPTQFSAWWADICQRRSMTTPAQRVLQRL